MNGVGPQPEVSFWGGVSVGQFERGFRRTSASSGPDRSDDLQADPEGAFQWFVVIRSDPV